MMVLITRCDNDSDNDNEYNDNDNDNDEYDEGGDRCEETYRE